MSKGLYKTIADIIREYEQDKAVINTDNLIEKITGKISLDEIPNEEKDRFILGCIARVALNSLGYRSIVRRKRVYVNPELMDKEDLGTILDSIDRDIDCLQAIRNKVSELESNFVGQMGFNSHMEISEDITTDELFELLQEKYG